MKLLIALFIPVLANGQILSGVIIGSGSSGLTVATPTDSPGAGTYTSSQAVTLNDTTPGATICYTTDGSTPTATTPGTCLHGTPYTTPFTLNASATVKAIGTKASYTNSGILSSSYVITVANPTTSNSGGSCTGSDGAGWTCSGTTTVSMADATSSAVICYRTDGTNPAATTPGACDAGSTQYSSGISTSGSTTFRMLGTKSGLTNSAVVTVAYTIGSTPSLISHSTYGNPTSGIDSTGAKLLAVCRSGSGTVTDSFGNSWTNTGNATGGSAEVSLWVVDNPPPAKTGPSHTVSSSNGPDLVALAAFSGITSAPSCDSNLSVCITATNGSSSSTSLAVTMTSNQTNDLVLTCQEDFSGSVPSVGSPYTLVTANSGGFGGMGYYVLPTATSTTANWTWTGAANVAVSGALYKSH